jgi:uncharacterized protein
MAETVELLQRIRDRLAVLYGDRLKRVILYGSMARGSAGPESDVDILVLLEDPVQYGVELRNIIDALFPLSMEIGRRISAKPVSITSYEKQECPLFNHAHEEGMVA